MQLQRPRNWPMPRVLHTQQQLLQLSTTTIEPHEHVLQSMGIETSRETCMCCPPGGPIQATTTTHPTGRPGPLLPNTSRHGPFVCVPRVQAWHSPVRNAQHNSQTHPVAVLFASCATKHPHPTIEPQHALGSSQQSSAGLHCCSCTISASNVACVHTRGQAGQTRMPHTHLWQFHQPLKAGLPKGTTNSLLAIHWRSEAKYKWCSTAEHPCITCCLKAGAHYLHNISYQPCMRIARCVIEHIELLLC